MCIFVYDSVMLIGYWTLVAASLANITVVKLSRFDWEGTMWGFEEKSRVDCDGCSCCMMAN